MLSSSLQSTTFDYISSRLILIVLAMIFFPKLYFVLYDKITTYNLRYRDKKGNFKPVRFSSYIWKRIDGFILDSLKAELEREKRQTTLDWERYDAMGKLIASSKKGDALVGKEAGGRLLGEKKQRYLLRTFLIRQKSMNSGDSVELTP